MGCYAALDLGPRHPPTNIPSLCVKVVACCRPFMLLHLRAIAFLFFLSRPRNHGIHGYPARDCVRAAVQVDSNHVQRPHTSLSRATGSASEGGGGVKGPTSAAGVSMADTRI